MWGGRDGRDKEFLFYSSLHDIHVRLDRIFCFAGIAGAFSASEYLGRTYLDHNTMKAAYRIGRTPSPIPQWRLQPSALTDPIFSEAVVTHIVEYFNINEGTSSGAINEWEAFKVVLRGFCMGKAVGIKKELEKALGTTEGKH